MEDVLLIILVALMMGGPVWRIGGWTEVRPTTMIIRMVFLLFGAVVLLFGEANLTWTRHIAAVLGILLGGMLVRRSSRHLQFKKEETALHYSLPWIYMLIPLVLLALSLLGGIALTGSVARAAATLGEFTFVSFWFSAYLMVMLRGNRFMLDELRALGL